ncbi:uncharacterized protein KY384_005747 [Bacidia gigantensis]|uniref:uncharacterized protein n=1 Tax=Bacidia gigantensis TaxID=2732470 RepID=UPI001D03AFBA|nr:uncharacterized protein KY384_005747 [Bacidia gigantensis]KAG8529112.1 hypothetical protein KY384_005747 [Bacidia gigantensis]
MPGITDLYISFTNDMISHHERSGTIHRISRANIERILLRELDKGKLAVDYKLSWYHAVLQTPLFDSLWYSNQLRLKLPESATQRYTPDETLTSYSLTSPTTPQFRHHPNSMAPPPKYPLSTSSTDKNNPYAKNYPREHAYRNRSPTPSISLVSGTETNATEESEEYDEDAVAFAELLGQGVSRQGELFEEGGDGDGEGQGEGEGGVGDRNGLRRQEGDDGAFGSGKGSAGKKRKASLD